MRAFLVAALLLSSAVPAIAGKPGPGGGSPPPNTEVGYRVLSGKSVKLMVANADASNAVSLYTSPTSFSFDLGPRSTNAIAIVSVFFKRFPFSRALRVPARAPSDAPRR